MSKWSISVGITIVKELIKKTTKTWFLVCTFKAWPWAEQSLVEFTAVIHGINIYTLIKAFKIVIVISINKVSLKFDLGKSSEYST